MEKTKSSRKLWLAALTVIAVIPLTLCGLGGMFYAKDQEMTRSAQGLPQAEAAYRKAGFCWTAEQCRDTPDIPKNENVKSAFIDVCTEAPWRVLRMNEIDPDLDRGAYADAQKKLIHFQKALDDARQVAANPHLDMGRDWDAGITNEYWELHASIVLAAALGARAEIEDAGGKLDAACQDLRTARRFAAFAGEEPTLLATLSDLVANSISTRTIERLAAHHASNPTDLSKLEHVITERPLEVDLSRALKSDAYCDLASMRNVNPLFLTRLEQRFDQAARNTDPTNLLHDGYPRRDVSKAYLTRILEAWTQIASIRNKFKKDPIALIQAQQVLVDRIKAHSETSYNVVKDVVPVVQDTTIAVLRGRTRDLCTIALLRAMEIHAKTGVFPRTVAQIPGKWTDPFTGKSLCLLSSSKGIRIYSVGPNRQDDHGVDRHEVPSSSDRWDVVAAYPPLKRFESVNPALRMIEAVELTRD